MHSDPQSQRRIRSGLFLGLILICGVARADEVVTNFSDGFGPWTPLHTGTWAIQSEEGNPLAALIEPGTQRPPVRRPTAYLFLQGHVWQNVTFTLRAMTLEPDTVTKRDVVLIFGYVDDVHYYYAHISALTDDTFHNIIMKVDGDQRSTIHREILPEARLTGGWHTIRVQHQRRGEIKVYVDDLDNPLMTADDTDYPVGSVAFGSFDDRALFDDVLVSGELVEPDPIEVSFMVVAEEASSMEFFGSAGFTYQIEKSLDLRLWEPVGEPLHGQDVPLTRQLESSTDDVSFFRVFTRFPALSSS
ncbi:MAG: hypothetical protein DRP71_08175 [Verrucomicrobia bacterium]|nr:MAG: hypothetical protein DRP71_08175 [Verrucomicrobiota bacterium]